MLMFRPLLRYADFRGRARRAEYWLFVLLQGLVLGGAFAMAIVSVASAQSDPGGAFLGFFGWLGIMGLASLIFFLPNQAVLARRLHDVGLSGFFLLLQLPNLLAQFSVFRSLGTRAARGGDPMAALQAGAAGPIAAFDTVTTILLLLGTAGSLALFVMTLMPGKTGPNRFGPDPKNPDAVAPTAEGTSGFDDARLDDLFAKAKREQKAAEGPYKPVFDFGPGPGGGQGAVDAAAPVARPAVDWGRPAYDPGVAPSRPFGRRT